MNLHHTDMTYGKSILGSERLFNALSDYYSRYFSPLTPVKPDHIATSNGMSPMLEHLATVISDEGDGWLLPSPYYNGFVGDLEATAKVRIVCVEIQVGQEGELDEVRAMDREMQRRKDEGVEQKITAVLVTNPHNPLGFCYKRETLLEYARFAERWNVFLVCDEIYALSVFESCAAAREPSLSWKAQLMSRSLASRRRLAVVTTLHFDTLARRCERCAVLARSDHTTLRPVEGLWLERPPRRQPRLPTQSLGSVGLDADRDDDEDRKSYRRAMVESPRLG